MFDTHRLLHKFRSRAFESRLNLHGVIGIRQVSTSMVTFVYFLLKTKETDTLNLNKYKFEYTRSDTTYCNKRMFNILLKSNESWYTDDAHLIASADNVKNTICIIPHILKIKVLKQI